MSGAAVWVKVELDADTALLGLVRELSLEIAGLACFESPEAEQIALAVVEAATNVIEHAYAGTAGGRMELRFLLDGELRVELLDRGRAVDSAEVPKLDLERYSRERRKGGLGLHLMGRIMDTVRFERRGSCNVCCLSKRLPRAAAQA